MITTQLINQAIERSRDGGRHGSCGLGFGETIERSLNPAFALTVADLAGAARPEAEHVAAAMALRGGEGGAARSRRIP